MEGLSPRQAAYPDDQGQLSTCTRHALAKACVDGFHQRKFHNEVLDFSQREVTQALISVHPGDENEGKWPHDFHGIQIPGSFQDLSTKKLWDIKMSHVQEVPKAVIYNLATTPSQDKTHVLVYVYSWSEYSLHTVYIRKVVHKDIPGRGIRTIISCINSHGVNVNESVMYPYVEINQTDNQFWEVQCRATELSTDDVANQGQLNLHAVPSPGSGYFGLDDYDENAFANSTKAALSEAYAEGTKKGLYPAGFDIQSYLDSNDGVKPTDFIITNDYEGAGGFTFNVEEISKDEMMQIWETPGESCQFLMTRLLFIRNDPARAQPETLFIQSFFELEGNLLAYCKMKINEDDSANPIVHVNQEGNTFYKVGMERPSSLNPNIEEEVVSVLIEAS